MNQGPIPPCPHCGKAKQGVGRKQQVHGWIEVYYFDDGETEMDHDQLVYGRFGPLRCLVCGHIRKDIQAIEEDNHEIIIPVPTSDD